MNDELENASKFNAFEELVFFLDLHNRTIHPLTHREEMFEHEFMPGQSREDMNLYIIELTSAVSTYKLPYSIMIQYVDGPDIAIRKLVTRDDYIQLLRDLNLPKDS